MIQGVNVKGPWIGCPDATKTISGISNLLKLHNKINDLIVDILGTSVAAAHAVSIYPIEFIRVLATMYMGTPS